VTKTHLNIFLILITGLSFELVSAPACAEEAATEEAGAEEVA